MRILDAHCHIGNIIYPHGGALIFEKGIAFPKPSLPQILHEKNAYRMTFLSKLIRTRFLNYETGLERKRLAAATLENFQKGLDESVEYCVCLPIAPFVTYEDVRAAGELNPRILPFTSPDFTPDDAAMEEKLLKDLEDGALGVKLHPILQSEKADGERMMRAASAAEKFSHGTPVIIHGGDAQYYAPAEGINPNKGYASAARIERLVSAFPRLNFIIGHAGLGEVAEVAKMLSKYENAYADTSFQTPEAIKMLVASFGGARVLFGSDWPYGYRRASVNAITEACGGDMLLMNGIFFDNAARLLKVEVESAK